MLHTLLASVMVLAIVMLATQRRRLVRRRWLGLPIGMFMHLVLDGAWTNTDVFWWPAFGTSFGNDRLPELDRGALSLVMELIGIVALLYAWNRYELRDPTRASGSCAPASFRGRTANVLIVVRHGQTDANARGVLLGRSDPALDATGRTQASAVAAALARPLASARRDTRIISSPLRRCRETAAIIAREGAVEIDERWIELDYGSFEGTPLVDVPDEMWVRWRSDADYAPDGGESLRALGARVSEACAELVDASAEHDVIVVTHVSPVKAATAWALGVGDEVTWRMYVAPGSITRIASRAGGQALISFNVTPWS